MQLWGLTFPLDGLRMLAHPQVLQEAQALGYTDAWTAEVDGNDAFLPVALAAAWTDRLRLGTAIANVFTRGPALLAQEAATMAEAAPGRFCLGIGVSSPAIVERWNGLKIRRPLERMGETVLFLRRALAGEKVSSPHLGVDGFRLTRLPESPPPIFVGALRGKMLALAGQVADGVIINWLAPGDVPQVVALVHEAARAAGRDPAHIEVACRIMVLPADDQAAWGAARRLSTAYLTSPFYAAFHAWLGRGQELRPLLEAWEAGDRRAALELVPEGLLRDLFVTGSRRECLQQIEAYRRAGVTLPILRFTTSSPDPGEQAEQNVNMLRKLASPY